MACGVCGVRAPASGVTPGETGGAERRTPHWPQKTCSVGFVNPQAGQGLGSWAPHRPQKFIPSRLVKPQCAQSICTPHLHDRDVLRSNPRCSTSIYKAKLPCQTPVYQPCEVMQRLYVPGQGHFVCGFRLVVPGSATLQRGFRSRAGARRSQGKRHCFPAKQDNCMTLVTRWGWCMRHPAREGSGVCCRYAIPGR